MMHRFKSFLAARSALRSLVVVMLAPVAMAAPAGAQGTMGTVPDPITSRDLAGYADRLQLSDQQRQALDLFHNQYKDEFAALREGDIEKFLDTNRTGGGFSMLMDRKQVEDGLKDLDGILNKVKSIDNRLFDQVQTVLTEEQLAQLPRVKQARDRARYRTGLSQVARFMNPATQVDLSEIMIDLELSAQESETVDPLVSQYESSLTSAARKLHEGTQNMLLEVLERLAAMGFTEEAMRDPERRGQIDWSAMRSVWSEVTQKLAEMAGDISDLNRKTVRNLTPVLNQEHGRELHDQFVERAYPEAHKGATAAASFAAALKFDELSEEQRATITALAVEFRAGDDRTVEQIMDLVDENRKSRTLFSFESDAQQKFQEAMDELRQKRTSLNETANQTLRATLGPELTEKLEQRVAKAADEGELKADAIAIAMAGPGGGAMIGNAMRVQLEGDAKEGAASDPYLPDAITRMDVEAYAARLKLPDDSISILLSLHDDYIEQFKALEQLEINPVRDAQQKLWSMNAGSGEVTPPTADAIDNMYVLRKKALEAIQVLDASFFSNVQAALLTEEQAPLLERVKQSRQRTVYNRGSADALGMPGRFPGGRRGGPGRAAMRFLAGGGSAESGVDLAALIEQVKPAPADPGAFDGLVHEYENAVTASFKQVYEASMRVQQTRDKMVAEATQDGEGGRGRAMQFGGNFRDLMEGEGKAARDAQKSITTLNRDTLAKLKGSLSEVDANALQRAYNRKAFPEIYRNARSTEKHLAAALELSDLTDQQRTQVQEMSAEYGGQYDTLCEQMVALEIQTPDIGDMLGGRGDRGPGDWQAMQQRMRDREKVEFERDDLSDKTIVRLRGVLNEDQIQRLGGLKIESDKE